MVKVSIKSLQSKRRQAIRAKVKETAVMVKFDINGQADVEDVIAYIRDMWHEHKFQGMVLKFVFKGHRKKVVEEVAYEDRGMELLF